MSSAVAPLAWAAVAVAGAAAGGLVAMLVAPFLGADEPCAETPSLSRRGWALSVVVGVGGALALWWWEVVALGQVPNPTAAGVANGVIVARFAGHLVLLALLTAAAWVDFRQRVIPDLITMPGVLVGLTWSMLAPEALLPIVVEVPRSFAAPLLEPDVLGLAGGLRTALPSWLESRPSWPGLVLAAAVFAGWWRECTAPFRAPEQAAGGPIGWLREPRALALIVGVPAIVAAWWRGGLAWHGLLTGLAGLTVASGMIWLTRAGASRALGREAMGLGDVTLMAMMGSWLGWQACVLVCFLAVFIGLLHGAVQVVRRRESELPFGPSLCLAAVLVVVAWRPLWVRAAASFERPLEMAAVIAAVIGLTAVSLMVWRRLR